MHITFLLLKLNRINTLTQKWAIFDFGPDTYLPVLNTSSYIYYIILPSRVKEKGGYLGFAGGLEVLIFERVLNNRSRGYAVIFTGPPAIDWRPPTASAIAILGGLLETAEYIPNLIFFPVLRYQLPTLGAHRV